jgi:oligoribonuclease
MSADDAVTFTPEESRLVWIDCEMTGLDIFHDELCEIAVVPTDFNFKVLDKGIDLVIKPSQAALDHMGDFVRHMHTENGLLERMKSGISYQDAEKKVIDYIRPFLPKKGKALLAGNTIGSDKKFLDHFMPHLTALLHYRSIDVSSIKELCRRWYPQVFLNKPAKHGDDRSLGDIIESIDELRYYRQTMFRPEPGISRDDARAISAQIEKSSLLRTYENEGQQVVDPDHASRKTI